MKKGILYSLSHYSWFQYKKMGRTRQTIQKRISNMKTHPRNKIISYFIFGAHQKFN